MVSCLSKYKFQQIISMIIVVLLIFFRFPYIILPRLIGHTNNATLTYIVCDATYVLSACFFIFNSKTLHEYNIHGDSMLIFILAPIITPLTYYILTPLVPLKPPAHYYYIQIITALILTIFIAITKVKFRRYKIKALILWTLASIVIGFIIGGSLGYIIGINNKNRYYSASFPTFIYLFVTQLSNAAVIEEPLFRGILWGMLKKLKLRDSLILLIQGLLFWLAHIYYIIQNPISFWIIVPICSIVLGWVVLKSKNIGTSMIVHAIINSFGNMVSSFKF